MRVHVGGKKRGVLQKQHVPSPHHTSRLPQGAQAIGKGGNADAELFFKTVAQIVLFDVLVFAGGFFKENRMDGKSKFAAQGKGQKTVFAETYRHKRCVRFCTKRSHGCHHIRRVSKSYGKLGVVYGLEDAPGGKLFLHKLVRCFYHGIKKSVIVHEPGSGRSKPVRKIISR